VALEQQTAEKAKSSIGSTFLQIFGLCAMVFAKPIFDVLVAYPEYLVVNRIQPVVLYLFTAGITLVLPLALTLCVESLALVSGRARLFLRAALVGILIGIFALQLTSRTDFLPPDSTAIFAVAVASVVAAGAFTIYGRVQALSLTLVVLSPVGILFSVLFLANPVMQRVLHPESMLAAWQGGAQAMSLKSKPPIFMLIFDELSLVDLLNSAGEIDAERFPNFASLASSSNWYANATTVRHATTWAIPAILTGRHARDNALPRYDDYPENLFSLLQGHYNFHVVEPVTELYKENTLPSEADIEEEWRLQTLIEDMAVVLLHFSLPESYKDALPSISSSWGDFVGNGHGGPRSFQAPENTTSVAMTDEERKQAKKAQERRFFKHLIRSNRLELVRSFISSIDAYPSNTLHFLHILLPHRPSIYLPSGRRYTRTAVNGVFEERKGKSWVGPQHLVDRLHQAHLLQTAMVDNLVGQLVGRMKEMGIYEDSLMVVVADHGVSFQQGVSNRRPDPANYGDLAFVPLFIKLPNQRDGILDQSNVETIDILPTIADAIGAVASWKFDGRSLIDSSASPRPGKTLTSKKHNDFEYSAEQHQQAKREALDRNRKAFSLDDPRADLYRYGPGLELVGRSVSELGPTENCDLQSPSLTKLRQVDINAEYLPLHIQGTVSCSEVDPVEFLLAAELNGKVSVVTRPYRFDRATIFDLIIPESDLRNGENEVELHIVAKQEGM
jgi:hypothetical protein